MWHGEPGGTGAALMVSNPMGRHAKKDEQERGRLAYSESAVRI